jgi:hypothetical protein
MVILSERNESKALSSVDVRVLARGPRVFIVNGAQRLLASSRLKS